MSVPNCPLQSDRLWLLFAAVLAGLALLDDTRAHAAESASERGEYVARAAGCMSCHGEDLAGGYQVKTPLGTIVASNISPSSEYGIGDYSRDDLADVLRRGVSPDRRLYPAMPYASYRGMSDEDIDLLFAWLQDQPAVDESPPYETEAPFPFNIRTGVLAWNGLFLGDRELPEVGDDPLVRRGAYLVNHLGHCGECHTPRNDFFAMQDEHYLTGERMDGWLAPNLTPDPIDGIGTWSEQDIVDYLRRGDADNVVQAAGPMAEFVSHGTHHLKEEDLRAIAAYLKALPAAETAHQDIVSVLPAAERTETRHDYGQIRDEMSAELARADLTTPERLYAEHCAACHGVRGQGQPSALYPPLIENAALRNADAGNLLKVLLHGVPAGKIPRAPAMPGFAGELSHDQIAELANYTRVTFGGRPDSALTAIDVTHVLTAEEEMPTPLRVLQILAWVGVLVVLALGAALCGWLVWRRHKRREANT
ncbi:MAG TPA: c-type cytochrome [Azoarcus sp.]|nr:c-type cytochrome [Azoarcus sp.]